MSEYDPLPKWVHEHPKLTPPPVFKPFDLKVGDIIKASTENVKGGKFKVIAISKHVIITEREAAENYKEAFPIIDYQCGMIKKVEA